MAGDADAAALGNPTLTRWAFDFTLEDGVVCRIDFRADPAVLAEVVPRRHKVPR